MKFYREAYQFKGDEFGVTANHYALPTWLLSCIRSGRLMVDFDILRGVNMVSIRTPEGMDTITPGGWLIRDTDNVVRGVSAADFVDYTLAVVEEPEAPAQAIHPSPDEFTEAELVTDPILRFFHYKHLPDSLKVISMPFCHLARLIIDQTPRSAERTASLRKLLEAKDCAVRASLPTP